MGKKGEVRKAPFIARVRQAKVRMGDGMAARWARFGPPAHAFVTMPEPFTPGSIARGRQILAGNFRLAGQLVSAPDTLPWDIAEADPAFLAELHGFAWLDDLMTLATREAQAKARQWLSEWLERFGKGRGPGWRADLAGRRLTRWISHAIILLHGADRAYSQRLFAAYAHHVRFLARRWKAAPEGMARIEALSGLLQGALALEGMERFATPALHGLDLEAGAILRHGGVPSRSPEELLEVFFRFIWANRALAAAGRPVPPRLVFVVDELARTLRSLRHRDGSLPAFHGGDRARGRLDQALVASGSRAMPGQTAAMGYAHARLGQLSLVMDAGPPPPPACPHGAAGALSFELVHGLVPIIVGAGPGHAFGPEAAHHARSTAAHSTVEIGGRSWGRFRKIAGPDGTVTERFEPGSVSVQLSQVVTPEGVRFLGFHDGYRPLMGLSHMRRIEIASGGRRILGEDTIAALSDEDRIRLEEALAASPGAAILCRALFHLAPGIEAEVDLAGAAVSLSLPDGSLWLMRPDPVVDVSILTTAFYDPARLHPRERQTIELRWEVIDHAAEARWEFELIEEGRQTRRGIPALAASGQNPQRKP